MQPQACAGLVLLVVFVFFNRAAAGVRGLRFTFGLFFLVLSVTWPRPLLGQVLVGTLNHATCNVYSPKAFETSIHENVTHIVFFIVPVLVV